MAKGKFSQPRNHDYDTPAAKRSSSGGTPRPTIAENKVSRKVKPQPPTAAATPAESQAPRAAVGYTPDEEFDFLQDAFSPADSDDALRRTYHPEAVTDEDLSEPRNTPRQRESGGPKPLLVGLCIVAVLLLGAVIAMVVSAVGVDIGIGSPLDPYDNKILNNVSVAGIDVSGMTRSEAISTIKNSLGSTYTKTDMMVILPDQEIRFSPDVTHADLDIKAAVDDAFDYGRTGTKEDQDAVYQKSFSEKYEVDVLNYLNLDQDYIRSTLESYAAKFSDLFTQSGYELEGEYPALDADHFDENTPCQTLLLKVGTPGFGLDINALYDQIMNSYRAKTFRVKVDNIDTETKPEPLDIKAIYNEISVKAEDATVDRTTFKIIPEKYGYKFSKKNAQELLDNATYGDVIRIPMTYSKPKILGEEAYFQDILGSCDTPHTNNENRNTNLRLACAQLDGYIIQPGETISYNEILGERTTEKGYKPAPAYSGNDVVDSIGGGICQGSSTLYYCALLADLEIVERINHGFVSSYIDYGMDATVSWGYPDLKIKNNFHCPIKIAAEVSDGKMRIKLLGTDEKDYYIKMQYVVTGTESPSTVYEEHGPNEGYTDGQVLKDGTTGIFVNTFKYKYSKETNELISKDKEARSIYKTVDKVVVKIVRDGSSGGSSGGGDEGNDDVPDTEQVQVPNVNDVEPIPD